MLKQIRRWLKEMQAPKQEAVLPLHKGVDQPDWDKCLFCGMRGLRPVSYPTKFNARVCYNCGEVSLIEK